MTGSQPNRAHGATSRRRVGSGLLASARSVSGGDAVVTAAREQTVRVVRPATAFLPYEERSAGLARRMVREKLEEWGLSDLVGDAELIISELVANSVRYTGCHRRMAVAIRRRDAHTVRLTVRDCSRTLPCLFDAGDTGERGRGMALVHALTKGRWGVELGPLGKTVHADLTVGAA